MPNRYRIWLEIKIIVQTSLESLLKPKTTGHPTEVESSKFESAKLQLYRNTQTTDLDQLFTGLDTLAGLIYSPPSFYLIAISLVTMKSNMWVWVGVKPRVIRANAVHFSLRWSECLQYSTLNSFSVNFAWMNHRWVPN